MSRGPWRRTGQPRGAGRGRSYHKTGCVESLAGQVQAAALADGWSVPCMFAADASLVTEAFGNVSVWQSSIGGVVANQTTPSARPEFGATALGGAPGISFDNATGDEELVVSSLSIGTGKNTMVGIVLMVNDGMGNGATVCTYGAGGDVDGFEMIFATSSQLQVRARPAGSGRSWARSGTGTWFSTRENYRGTFDGNLTTEETATYAAGVDETSTWPQNGNSTVDMPNSLDFTIGGYRANLTIGALVLLVGDTSPIPTTGITEIESLLIAAANAGSFL